MSLGIEEQSRRLSLTGGVLADTRWGPAVKGDGDEGAVERSGPLIVGSLVAQNHQTGMRSDDLCVYSTRLEAECGLCGYTTDKCSCDYGI